MLTRTRIAWSVLVLVLLWGTWACAQAPRARPLSEAALTNLIDLQIKDEEIIRKVELSGLAFAPDAEALDRLRKAGASDAVLAAVKAAGQPANAITYQGVHRLLREGTPEGDILKRLGDSPTTFTLNQDQVAELQKAGASDKLLDALQKNRTAIGPGSDINDFAVILDCSGSMADKTPEGTTKMEAAKKVVRDFILDLPNGKRLTFIVYGHQLFGNDKEKGCGAVEVVLRHQELSRAIKGQLVRCIDQLQPLGWTPLAASLKAARQDLSGVRGMCQVLVVTDGMETCGGDPLREVEDLEKQINLPHGVDIVGFIVTPEEKKAVEAIVDKGRGKYYDSKSAQDLGEQVRRAAEDARRAAERAEAAARRAEELRRAADLEEQRAEEERRRAEQRGADEEARRAREAAAPAEEARKPGVLASETLPDGWVVEVLDLQRTSGNMLKMRWRYRNATDERHFAKAGGSFYWEKVYLFAPATQKQYHIARAPDGTWMAGGGGAWVKPNGASELWAKFPAPPATTRKVTVYLPDVPPLEDLRIAGTAGGAAPDDSAPPEKESSAPRPKRFLGFGQSVGFGRDQTKPIPGAAGGSAPDDSAPPEKESPAPRPKRFLGFGRSVGFGRAQSK
jgi:hypothetical protein